PDNAHLQNLALRTATMIGSSTLVVGGAGGVFALPLINGGAASWGKLATTPLPHVNITDLRYVPPGAVPPGPLGQDHRDPLVIATLGRGVFLVKHASDLFAPEVSNVVVDGTAWTAAYLSFLQPQGRNALGYSIPVGTGALQLRPLPFTNLNQIRITFSRN